MTGKYLLLALLATAAFAQDPVSITPYQLIDARAGNAIACSNCSIYTYAAGTNTPLATYTSSTLATPNTNPVLTNSAGYAVNGATVTGIWVGSSCYKFVAKDSSAVTLFTQDNICDRGAVLKALLAAATGATLVGFQPTGGTVPTTVAAALNSAFLYSTGYSTLALACAAANSANKTLAYVATFANSPAQVLNCDIWVPSGTGALIQPASGAAITMAQGRTVTAADFKIADQSTSGTFQMLLSPTPGRVKWWGAKCDGTTDDATAIGYALPATLHLIFPIGTCASSTAQSVTLNGQHITCAGTGYQGTAPTILQFTGATNGLTINGIRNIEIDDCSFQTTNAGAGKLLNVTSSSGNKFRNLSFFNTGAGAATHGLYGSAMESTAIYSPYCYGVAKCISLNAVSNATDIYSPLIGGSGTVGIEILDSTPVNIWGGTIQGSYTAGLVTEGGAAQMNIESTYMESSGGQAHIIDIAAGNATITNLHLGGGSVTSDAINIQAGSGAYAINGMAGFVTTPASLIKVVGSATATAQPLIISGMKAYNASVAGTAHSLSIGDATHGFWTATLTGNYFRSTGDAVVLGNNGGYGSVFMAGNTFNSSGYGIDATLYAAGGNLDARGNNFASVLAMCNGCKANNTAPLATNTLNNVQLAMLVGVQVYADLPGCNQYTERQIWTISDATAATWGTTVTGGGANRVQVVCTSAVGWTVFGK